MSFRPAGVTQSLPQLHQVRPRSHHQPADVDLSGHQVGLHPGLDMMFAPRSVSMDNLPKKIKLNKINKREKNGRAYQSRWRPVCFRFYPFILAPLNINNS